ncbi:MAG TPA: ATP-binding cassette domain-containing protein [Vicinamibacterales bacterium]|nr:ATP-binding cassette domain-containing protein [Vicinamibacterales bacterium]
MNPPVLEFAGVTKHFGSLRPLRVADLRVASGQRTAIVGLDRPSAEVFVNLATGATLPDAGDVTLLGRRTSAITDSGDWLATVDRVGIVSERAVLLDRFTVIQNLAMPFTLDLEPPPPAERARAEALAREVGLDEPAWTPPLSQLDANAAMRVRLGRAVALDPAVLLLEHASASLPRAAAAAFAATVRAIAAERGIAVVALTADEPFARALDGMVLIHEAASGRLKESGGGWFAARRRR